MNPVQRFINFILQPDYKRTFSILAALAILVTIPLTVYVAQQSQDIRQRASEEEPPLPETITPSPITPLEPTLAPTDSPTPTLETSPTPTEIPTTSPTTIPTPTTSPPPTDTPTPILTTSPSLTPSPTPTPTPTPAPQPITAYITGPGTGAVGQLLTYTATMNAGRASLSSISIRVSRAASDLANPSSWITLTDPTYCNNAVTCSQTVSFTPTDTKTRYIIVNATSNADGTCGGYPNWTISGPFDCDSTPENGTTDAIMLTITASAPSPAPTKSLASLSPSPTPSPAPKTASKGPHNPDVDRNKCVGIADFSAWLYAFQHNKKNIANTFPDIDNDIDITILDFNIWLNAMRSGQSLCAAR